MKRIIICILALILIVSVMGCSASSIANPEPNDHSFSLDDFERYLENYPYDKNIGEIKDENTAIEKAIKEWSKFEEYTNHINSKYVDSEEIEYEALYDEKHDCWLVRVYYEDYYENYNEDYIYEWWPHLIVESDGDVLTLTPW